MGEGSSIIRIDIGIDGFSKPAMALIEKVSQAVGGYCKPYQMKRIAKAKADVDIIETQTQIKITQLQRRALTRWVAEESKRQANIEEITRKAIPQLSDSSNPRNMDDDWITNFFDKCRIVSDEEMQLLWSRVLAGEANSPGTYSKRTVNLLGSLDKVDAQLFTVMCGFAWVCGNLIPLVFDEQSPTYTERGVNFDTLCHLDDIGLISFGGIADFKEGKLPQRFTVSYYEEPPLTIDFNQPENNQLDVGKVLFTQTGRELARICGARPIDGFYEYVRQYWSKQGLSLSSPAAQGSEAV